MTVREALALAAERLGLAGVEDAPLEARILLEHALGLDRARLLARPLLPLATDARAAYDALVARRARREPLPYILGRRPFRRLDLLVDCRALIPRSETELLVEMVLGDLTPWPSFAALRTGSSLPGKGEAFPLGEGAGWGDDPTPGKAGVPPLPLGAGRGERPLRGKGETLRLPAGAPPLPLGEGRGEGSLAADVGTGTGAVAISLAVEAPALRVYATDLSPDALALARENATRHGVADRLTFLLGDLLDSLPEPVDLIVANLPYVPTAELGAQAELGWEPRLALDGGPDGLDLYRRLLARAPERLRPGGRLLFEIGAEQGEAAVALARRAFPGAAVRVHRDYAGRDRVVEVRTPRA